MSLLQVKELSIRFAGDTPPALENFSLDVTQGESVALVGESGAGKTQAALALMGLSNADALLNGSVQFDGQELIGASEATWRKFRAQRIAMVYQDPNAALNPYRRIGDQLGMVLEAHDLASGRAAQSRVRDVLSLAGLPDPDRQARAFPHELSGGMRQRAMIAAALIAEPALLIADEPTTAIDATIQAQILLLLRQLRAETGTALLLISHDLGVVAGQCERLLVLHEGRVIERGDTAKVFQSPQHEQTRAMLSAVQNPETLVTPLPNKTDDVLLNVRDLSVSYGRGREPLIAVKSSTFDLRPGETLSIVGESGSGKTSLARAVLGLVMPASGSVVFLGETLATELHKRATTELRGLQLVFQDPQGSLDPAMQIAETLAEPLRVHQPELGADQRAASVDEALSRVGLEASFLGRLPHQLSGGEAQRVAIARALIIEPRVLICDEAVASLDSHVRGDVLRLLADEQRRTGLAIVFISHDLNVVRQISHRVMVMYLGRLIEVAESQRIFERPRHPYTRALIDSMPGLESSLDAESVALSRETASLSSPAGGCVFQPRCRYAQARCEQERPKLEPAEGGAVACHRAGDLDLAAGAMWVDPDRIPGEQEA